MPPCTLETPIKNIHTHKDSKSIQNYDKSKISFYLSNINSKTDSAMTHIFNKCSQHHVLSLLESRVISKHSEQLVHTFRSHRRKCFLNPAVPSDLGGLAHGGEVISTRSNMSAKPVSQNILNYIQEHTNSTLRFCAVYIRLTKLTFLFVNAYLWDSVGPKHPKNFSIFLQIELLSNLLKLHIFFMLISIAYRKN